LEILKIIKHIIYMPK